MTISGEFVVIAANKLDTGRPFTTLSLSPTAAEWVSGDPKVRIDIMNEEGSRIVSAGPSDDLVQKVARLQDRIFESVYRLSPFSPPPEETPMPVAERFIGDPRGSVAGPPAVGSPPCSPGRAEPV